MVGSIAPHVFDKFFRLLRGDATLFSQDLAKNSVDLTSHVSGVSTDVEIGLFLQKIVDNVCILAQAMLDIDLLRAFTRKCSEELERISELFLVGL